MRRVKAEGGWGVVCTEEVEIHPTSDVAPFVELRIWDDEDVPALARIAEQIHARRRPRRDRAGVQRDARREPLQPGDPARPGAPARALVPPGPGPGDVRWRTSRTCGAGTAPRSARAIAAGYDLVYVYAGHDLAGLQHFLSPRYNQRTDVYGGSPANRMRLLREILEDTVEEAAGRAAVACRLTVDELAGPGGLGRCRDRARRRRRSAELPDLWDFVLGSWEDDSNTSRVRPGGRAREYVRGLKALTTKPVVGVGRFTSPDTMVRQVNQGILDLIGAARPSIADPFLPERSRKAGSTTSASASAATSASPATTRCRRSAARRTRPWARSGGAAGTRSECGPRGPTPGCSSSVPDRPVSRRPGRSAARLRRDAGRGDPRARRPRLARVAAAWAGRLGPGPGLPRAADLQRPRLVDVDRERRMLDDALGVRFRARGDRHRRDLAAATASAAGTRPGAGDPARRGSHPRRPHGRTPSARQARRASSTTTTTTWVACSPSCSAARGTTCTW